MKTLTKLFLSAGLLAGFSAAAFAYSMWMEPFWIEFERRTIRLPGAAGRLPKQGLRILHLSDSHFHGGRQNEREHAKIEQIRRLTAGVEYDLLIHTGDFWHDNAGLENLLALLDAVPKPKLGSYGVFGNHDYYHFDMKAAPGRMWQTFNHRYPQHKGCRHKRTPVHYFKKAWDFFDYFRNTPLDGPPCANNDPNRLQRELEKWGMKILHNQSIPLSFTHTGVHAAFQMPPSVIPLHSNGTHPTPSYEAVAVNGKGSPIGFAPATVEKIATISSLATTQERPMIHLVGVDDWCEGRPDLASALANVPVDAPVILLSHNPDVVEDKNLHRVDLMLSGHTHGGQIVAPLWGPAHTQSASFQRHEAAGYVRRGKTQIYISRGLGEGIPLRFACRPQVTLLTIVA